MLHDCVLVQWSSLATYIVLAIVSFSGLGLGGVKNQS